MPVKLIVALEDLAEAGLADVEEAVLLGALDAGRALVGDVLRAVEEVFVAELGGLGNPVQRLDRAVHLRLVGRDLVGRGDAGVVGVDRQSLHFLQDGVHFIERALGDAHDVDRFLGVLLGALEPVQLAAQLFGNDETGRIVLARVDFVAGRELFHRARHPAGGRGELTLGVDSGHVVGNNHTHGNSSVFTPFSGSQSILRTTILVEPPFFPRIRLPMPRPALQKNHREPPPTPSNPALSTPRSWLLIILKDRLFPPCPAFPEEVLLPAGYPCLRPPRQKLEEFFAGTGKYTGVILRFGKLNPLLAEAGRFNLRLKSRFRLKPVLFG